MKNSPKLYIRVFENGESKSFGPFWTICPDGCGAIIGQDWIAFRVQSGEYGGIYTRITVPKCCLILSK